MLEGPIRFALLDWALTQGIFDLCETPLDAAAVAAAKSYDADQCLIALRALVAAGFLKHVGAAGQQFAIADDIAPYVTTHSSTSMVENLKAMAALRHAGLKDFEALLRPERPQLRRPLFDADHWDRTYSSLKQFHQAMAVETMAGCIFAMPEWQTAKRILDVGPGSATLARRLLAERPDLEITLLDLPPVAERVAQDAADLDITIHAGSYNDALPEGPFDIVWSSMTLYFHDTGLEALIVRLASLLSSGRSSKCMVIHPCVLQMVQG